MGIRCNLTTSGNMRGNMYRGVGGGGTVVEITPTYNSGTKIADYSLDGEAGAIYIPTTAYSETTLWEGSGYSETVWNLSDSYKNYDAIAIYVRGGTGDNYISSQVIPTSVLEIVQSTSSFRYGVTTDGWYTYFYVRSDTQFERADTSQIYVNKIIGIKYV